MLDYNNTNDDLVMVYHRCQLTSRKADMFKTALLVHRSVQDPSAETSSGIEVVLINTTSATTNKRQDKKVTKRFTKDAARSISGKIKKLANKTQNDRETNKRTAEKIRTVITNIKRKEQEADILESGDTNSTNTDETKQGLPGSRTELSRRQQHDIMYVSHCMKALFQYCDSFTDHDDDWLEFLHEARKEYSSLSMAFDYPYDDKSAQLAKLYELFHWNSTLIDEETKYSDHLIDDLKILRNIHKDYLHSRRQ